MTTNSDREYAYYICGRCKHEIYNLKSEDPIIPCSECGWIHGTRRKNDIPTEIKLNLANPNG